MADVIEGACVDDVRRHHEQLAEAAERTASTYGDVVAHRRIVADARETAAKHRRFAAALSGGLPVVEQPKGERIEVALSPVALATIRDGGNGVIGGRRTFGLAGDIEAVLELPGLILHAPEEPK